MQKFVHRDEEHIDLVAAVGAVSAVVPDRGAAFVELDVADLVPQLRVEGLAAFLEDAGGAFVECFIDPNEVGEVFLTNFQVCHQFSFHLD